MTVEGSCGEGEFVHYGVETLDRGSFGVVRIEEDAFVPGDETSDGLGMLGSIENH
jgi:hypothetical protein